MYYVPCVLKGKFAFLKGTYFYPVKQIKDMFHIKKVKFKNNIHKNEEFDVVLRGIPQTLIDIYIIYENDTFEIVKPC